MELATGLPSGLPGVDTSTWRSEPRRRTPPEKRPTISNFIDHHLGDLAVDGVLDPTRYAEQDPAGMPELPFGLNTH